MLRDIVNEVQATFTERFQRSFAKGSVTFQLFEEYSARSPQCGTAEKWWSVKGPARLLTLTLYLKRKLFGDAPCMLVAHNSPHSSLPDANSRILNESSAKKLRGIDL